MTSYSYYHEEMRLYCCFYRVRNHSYHYVCSSSFLFFCLDGFERLYDILAPGDSLRFIYGSFF